MEPDERSIITRPPLRGPPLRAERASNPSRSPFESQLIQVLNYLYLMRCN